MLENEYFPPKQGVSGLSRIRKGPAKKPPRLLVYGTPGIGKSTFAAGAPDPIFVPTEDGLDALNVDSFPMAKSYQEVKQNLTELTIENHDYQTVVIDSLDWMERLIWDHVCQEDGKKSIEKVAGGFAKGYTLALIQWREILDLLNRLRDVRGMIVLLIAHAKVERFEDPETAAYDRYSVRLHKHADALVTEWVDAVLFATRKMRVQTEDAGFNRKRGIAQGLGKDGGDRILRTTGGPSCVAKNRYGMTEEIPLDWGAFQEALANRF